MGRRLTLDLPDDAYEAVSARARALGKTPEQVAIERLTAALDMPGAATAGSARDGDRSKRENGDPLASLVGTLACEVTDIADQHDEYIGRSIADASAVR